MAIASGTRLGPYEVLAPIGAGGMGEVYRGRDTRLDRSVAIKVIPPEFAQRFEREAKSISALNHPHICTLFDVGPNYLVMELLEGESLADRLAKGPLPLEQVLRYGIQIADALDKAHRQGIIHRDLKPGNVMITKSGAKLLDFGLAKDSVGAGPLAGSTVRKPLTEEGTILGTFQYMAPEQLEGIPADARTDIFALGAVLYEMATGKRAFEGKTRTSLIAAIVGANPQPMSQIQPLTPPALEHVVRKCLAKEPDDRWQSAHDIAEELRWISEAGSQAGVAAPITMRRKSRERLAWGAAVLVAVAAGAFAAHRYWQEPKPVYRFTVPMIDSGYKNGVVPLLSPDGRALYFAAANADGVHQIFRRDLDELKARPIAETEHVAAPLAISPDGRTLILGYAGAVLKSISVDGGPMQTLADGVEGGVTPASGVAVASDGTILVGGGGIRRLLPGGRVEWLLKADTAHGESFQFPRFLPDSTRYLFISSTLGERGIIRRFLCASRLGSQQITRIGEVPTRVEYARDHVFYVRDGTLMAQPFNVRALKFTGDAIPVMDNVLFNPRFGTAYFSTTADGTIACRAPAAGSHLVWVDRAGKKSQPACTITHAGSFALMPGSKRVIAAINDFRAGVASLWLNELSRDAPTRVTFQPVAEGDPVVTPDGKELFYTSDLRLNEVPLDGSAPSRHVIGASAGVQAPSSISSDGRFLLYTTNENQRETAQDIWVLPLTGGTKPYPFLVTPAIEDNGTFSPDSKWVAYWSNATGTGQIYVRPFPGPGPARVVSTKGGHAPRFSRAGKNIYFADGDKLMAADFRSEGAIGEPAVVIQLDENIQQFEPMPDGRFLMLLQKDADSSPPVRIITNWRPPAK